MDEQNPVEIVSHSWS